MIFFVVLCGVAAWAATAFVRRHSVQLRLVQVPNERSSHVRPTPTGGGVGIALTASIFGVWVAWQSGSPLWIILLLSLAFAMLGLLDDIVSLRSALRFPIQMLLICILIGAMPALPAIEIFGLTISGWPLLAVIAFVGLWWINLFNFMDGIDGLAGLQGIVMLLAAAILCSPHLTGIPAGPVWWWFLAVAAATAGFLGMNFPPARIFMGDAGSNYLAFMIFALALLSISAGWLSYQAWAVLAAVFVCDATVTLLRRILNRERWWAGHRQHAYQHLARRLASHRSATLIYTGVNLLFVVPLAFAANSRPQEAWLLVVVAYLILVISAVFAGAGRSEDGK
ncbi:glycosyltransferase family 4 protein [Mesorhizobium sp. CGMCC 1.15528]|uniref:Glycosyltransferase family 4 protein n=1 Tax=Mesorhizobium zhangyense TaxID=1776730 RepID=A0A7C9VA03_9HYPH|nr:glycosyltransferase family 4 protein [Mesorhizobium zhangyense]